MQRNCPQNKKLAIKRYATRSLPCLFLLSLPAPPSHLTRWPISAAACCPRQTWSVTGPKRTPQEGKQSVAATENENETQTGIQKMELSATKFCLSTHPTTVYMCIYMYKYICTIYVYQSSLHFKLPRRCCRCCCCCMPHGPTASRRSATQTKSSSILTVSYECFVWLWVHVSVWVSV